jgi:hypothetical protein
MEYTDLKFGALPDPLPSPLILPEAAVNLYESRAASCKDVVCTLAGVAIGRDPLTTAGDLERMGHIRDALVRVTSVPRAHRLQAANLTQNAQVRRRPYFAQ